MSFDLLVVYILFAHFIADFVCQTDNMAKNKSTSWTWLGIHVCVYQLVLLAFCFFITTRVNAAFYSLINAAIHFGVDAITSRISSKLWKEGKVHEFFVCIGADQFIHAMTLILTLRLMN